jgi:hypothetical protein
MDNLITKGLRFVVGLAAICGATCLIMVAVLSLVIFIGNPLLPYNKVDIIVAIVGKLTLAAISLFLVTYVLRFLMKKYNVAL